MLGYVSRNVSPVVVSSSGQGITEGGVDKRGVDVVEESVEAVVERGREAGPVTTMMGKLEEPKDSRSEELIVVSRGGRSVSVVRGDSGEGSRCR